MRQRAVDLLYAMCDRSNAEEIVAEMLSYLEAADYSIREEMVRACVCVCVFVCVWWADTLKLVAQRFCAASVIGEGRGNCMVLGTQHIQEIWARNRLLSARRFPASCQVGVHVCVLLQVLKVAILAEKYAVDYTWYVDTILNLIRIAGDYVSEEVSSPVRPVRGSSQNTSRGVAPRVPVNAVCQRWGLVLRPRRRVHL